MGYESLDGIACVQAACEIEPERALRIVADARMGWQNHSAGAAQADLMVSSAPAADSETASTHLRSGRFQRFQALPATNPGARHT